MLIKKHIAAPQNFLEDIDIGNPADMIAAMELKIWLDFRRGRTAALAAHLKVPGSMVSNMASGRKQVPLEHCPGIQEFTNNEVTCEELRPDKADYFSSIRCLAPLGSVTTPVHISQPNQ